MSEPLDNPPAASPASPSGPTYVVNCCNCGRIVDTREKDEGGDGFGAELSDGRWTCSPECWDAVVEPAALSSTSAGPAVAEIVIENDHWSGGHFLEGRHKTIRHLVSPDKLPPVGTTLYAHPAPASEPHAGGGVWEACAATCDVMASDEDQPYLVRRAAASLAAEIRAGAALSSTSAGPAVEAFAYIWPENVRALREHGLNVEIERSPWPSAIPVYLAHPAPATVQIVKVLEDVGRSHPQYCETMFRAAEILAALAPATEGRKE